MTESAAGGGVEWPANPVIFEINTWVWLDELAKRLGRPVNLGSLPDEAWDDVLPPGIDAVWLMGVWQRSPAGVEVALGSESLRTSLVEALPDFTPADVVGSPYCIRNYTVDEHLGGDAGLAAAREALRRRGLLLVLDYVPNHVAPDHPWVGDHPEFFVTVPRSEAEGQPDEYRIVGERGYAMGRDPYFPPWTDVLQLDAFDPGLRSAATDTVGAIADRCDGVRCDMAMLLLDDVFSRTWGNRGGAPLPEPYWRSLISAVRAEHPTFRFMAEAYWDLESTLIDQGFDACYDKRLYDRLVETAPEATEAHLGADPTYQAHLVRFLENHDEPRAAATFPPDVHRAAAIVVATLPGVLLLHEGQLDGRHVRIPVQLSRRPEENLDPDLRAFYLRLLPIAAAIRGGSWQRCDTDGWPDNDSHRRLLAWTWSSEPAGEDGRGQSLVVVNYCGQPSQGRVRLPWPDVGGGGPVALVDEITGQRFERDGDELATEGLFVDLGPWQAHALTLLG